MIICMTNGSEGCQLTCTCRIVRIETITQISLMGYADRCACTRFFDQEEMVHENSGM